MKFVRIFLQCVGALALLSIAAVSVYAFVTFSGPTKSTAKDEAEFVLNWAGLDTAQNWTVVDGLVSERNITGDHTDYYCIQLQNASVEPGHAEWQTGPEGNRLLARALEQAIGMAKSAGADCLPAFEQAGSEQMRIMFWSMSTHGRRPSAAQVLLLEPSSKRLFYVSFAT